MKKLILTAFSALTIGINAQSLERQVIGSTGGSFSGSFQVDWTVGETVTATATGGSVILTQGFQQPSAISNSIRTLQTAANVIAYPNPGSGDVTVEWKTGDFTGSLVLYDATGRVVWNSEARNMQNTRIDMATFAPGMYTLQLNRSDNQASTLRIIRN